MKLSDMKPFEEVLAEDLQDSAFRREWERTEIARAVALQVVQYRATHHLTQEELAAKLGVKQPAIARLEAGDHQPSVMTLRRLADRLGMEFHIRSQEFRMVSANERLNMQISDEDGERVARMMNDPAFRLRIQPSSLPGEDAE